MAVTNSVNLSSGVLDPKSKFVTVIMAGGSGTRFWPLSRQAKPKQFLPLSPNGQSLIQATAERTAALGGELLVVTAENQVALVKEHLPNAKILAEPIPKNTAACIGYAAIKVQEEIGDCPMVFLPADHLISGVEELTRTLRRAVKLVGSDDHLVTIGIPPSYPETGYGYIRRGEPLQNSDHSYLVHSFVEKPNKERAMEYLASGEYFWNSGMFVWRSQVILKALAEHLPALTEKLKELITLCARDFPRDEVFRIFEKMESISIDYGVLERAKNVIMLAGVGFRWSDVGSWSSWKDTIDDLRPSENRNVSFGDAKLIDCEDTLILSSKQFIAGVGLKGLIVVETDDAILVCQRESAQDVRKVIEFLKERKRTELI